MADRTRAVIAAKLRRVALLQVEWEVKGKDLHYSAEQRMMYRGLAAELKLALWKGDQE